MRRAALSSNINHLFVSYFLSSISSLWDANGNKGQLLVYNVVISTGLACWCITSIEAGEEGIGDALLNSLYSMPF